MASEGCDRPSVIFIFSFQGAESCWRSPMQTRTLEGEPKRCSMYLAD